jgi:polyisoprenoid-binding protein YceI
MDADGRFHRFEGEVRVDPRAPEQAHVTVSVDALSVDTGIRRRDNHLRSEDFFDVARFPLITFTSQRITPAEGKALVTGALSFHGITREVTVPVELELGGPSLRARGGFTIRMSDFGITYRSFLNPIRDEVEILFDLRGVPEP